MGCKEMDPNFSIMSVGYFNIILNLSRRRLAENNSC
jgi:hypothetical protein